MFKNGKAFYMLIEDGAKRLEMQHEIDNWFTVEMIDETTYAISEYKHCEETHCYLLIGDGKALLIDTGLGVANIKEVVEAITSLPVLAVATHVHWDHIGDNEILMQKAFCIVLRLNIFGE